MSMAPSSKRGTASMSGVGPDKIPVAVFVLSPEPVVVVISDSWTRAFFVKRVLGRYPYTNIFDASDLWAVESRIEAICML